MTTTMEKMAPRAEAPPGRFDARLRTSIGSVAVAGAALTLCALAFAGLGAALSVAAGASLAAGNLWLLARIVTALLPEDSAGAEAQSRAGWALAAVLKMFGLLALAWLLMRHGIVSPLPMLVGFTALPIGIAIGSLVSDRRPPPDRDG
jgi:ATP synthase I chain